MRNGGAFGEAIYMRWGAGVAMTACVAGTLSLAECIATPQSCQSSICDLYCCVSPWRQLCYCQCVRVHLEHSEAADFGKGEGKRMLDHLNRVQRMQVSR